MPASKRWSTVFDFIYDPVFSERAAARQLGENPETLKKWRQRSRGPAYIQYGKNGVVRYSRSALRAYVNRPFRSTIPDEAPSFDGRDAAVILGVEPTTLKKWRRQNRGPASVIRRGNPFFRNGTVRYRLSALMEYRTSCTSPP